MRRLMIVSLVLIAMAAPARAQDDKKYDVNIGGGAMFPLGTFKDSFDTGGNFAVGATYFITPVIGIQGEYNYDRMNGPERTLGLSLTPGAPVTGSALIQSNQQMNVGLFDLVVRSRPRDHVVGGYVLGGGGVYHREVELTSPAVGYTTVCDPYWFVCYPAATSVDQVLGSRSSTDFGINVGGGVTFGHEAKFYVELRYHYVWGPTINPPAGVATTTSVSTNAHYLPLVFGVRF